MARIKKVKSECFATHKCDSNSGDGFALVSALLLGEIMDHIKFYEVSSLYVEYLASIEKNLFQNKKIGQQNERKYIGIVLTIKEMDYFAPLSSFKDKHKNMKDSLDFIKIKNYAVINLNNMFPVPDGEYKYVDISKVQDSKYKSLLLAEYRFIKSIEEKIRKNAFILYNHKIKNGDNTALAKRCNNFMLLEEFCRDYNK